MRALLKELAVVSLGHPFRGKIEPVENGNGSVIQIKNINEEGEIFWHDLQKVNVKSRLKVDWLQALDIILPNRGTKTKAACIIDPPSKVVTTPHFYNIRVRDSGIDPKFLTWQINQIQTQRYFEKTAEGSRQLSLRKSIVENIEVVIPSIVEQQTIISIYEAAQKEKAIYNKLLQNRATQLKCIANAILQLN
jgi:restriction endonuclease S subunit